MSNLENSPITQEHQTLFDVFQQLKADNSISFQTEYISPSIFNILQRVKSPQDLTEKIELIELIIDCEKFLTQEIANNVEKEFTSQSVNNLYQHILTTELRNLENINPELPNYKLIIELLKQKAVDKKHTLILNTLEELPIHTIDLIQKILHVTTNTNLIQKIIHRIPDITYDNLDRIQKLIIRLSISENIILDYANIITHEENLEDIQRKNSFMNKLYNDIQELIFKYNSDFENLYRKGKFDIHKQLEILIQIYNEQGIYSEKISPNSPNTSIETLYHPVFANLVDILPSNPVPELKKLLKYLTFESPSREFLAIKYSEIEKNNRLIRENKIPPVEIQRIITNLYSQKTTTPSIFNIFKRKKQEERSEHKECIEAFINLLLSSPQEINEYCLINRPIINLEQTEEHIEINQQSLAIFQNENINPKLIEILEQIIYKVKEANNSNSIENAYQVLILAQKIAENPNQFTGTLSTIEDNRGQLTISSNQNTDGGLSLTNPNREGGISLYSRASHGDITSKE